MPNFQVKSSQKNLSLNLGMDESSWHKTTCVIIYACPNLLENTQTVTSILTHLNGDQIAAIFQTTPWNSFSLIKMSEIRYIYIYKIFRWILFLNWQYAGIGSDNGLTPKRRQAIIWTNGSLVYWRVYVSLGLDDLKTNPPTMLRRSQKHEFPECGSLKEQWYFATF